MVTPAHCRFFEGCQKGMPCPSRSPSTLRSPVSRRVHADPHHHTRGRAHDPRAALARSAIAFFCPLVEAGSRDQSFSAGHCGARDAHLGPLVRLGWPKGFWGLASAPGGSGGLPFDYFRLLLVASMEAHHSSPLAGSSSGSPLSPAHRDHHLFLQTPPGDPHQRLYHGLFALHVARSGGGSCGLVFDLRLHR